MKIENKENVSLIIMKPNVHCLCAIGQDWYTIELAIEFIPTIYYPDYMDVVRWLGENIDGKEMNIEHALAAIKQYFMQEYDPADVTVRGVIKDATTHFPVEVII